jgi:two-component system, NtrC family, response regulator AtoC
VVYNWPGNIRELENVMERTILFSEGPEIRLENLPPELLHLGPTPVAAEDSGGRVTGPGMAAVGTGAPGLPAAAASAAGGWGPAPTSATPTPMSLPAPLVPAPAAAAPPSAAGSLKEAVRAETERVERELIQRALDETGGNVTQAARKLKISRKSLQTKMKEFGLRDREITKQGDQET